METFNTVQNAKMLYGPGKPSSTRIKNLESVLWKLLLLSFFACFVWSEQFTIQVGQLVISKPCLKYETNPHHNNSQLNLFESLSVEKKIYPDVATLSGAECLSESTHNTDVCVLSEGKMPVESHCRQFVKIYAPVAISEMRYFGIPASILLAQAILASDAGMDSTAQLAQNYFLRACHNEACELEHFSHPDIDGEMDVYNNAWSSFRQQSIYLSRHPAFAGLKGRSAEAWVSALTESGYSEDLHYGEKLLQIIHALNLEDFDSDSTFCKALPVKSS
jgi:hypothetical protein